MYIVYYLYYFFIFVLRINLAIHFLSIKLQGQPLGFDTKYLALADRNMQVSLSLKMVGES